MNNKKYTRNLLTDYLLGVLPPEETENFDEASFTDDDFADDLKSAENDLVDAYIHGELENPQLSRFEIYYLASPLRREKVEFARALQVVAEKKIVVTSQVTETPTWAGFFASWNIFANFNSALSAGLAAVLLAFVGIFGWFLLSDSFQKPIEQVKIETTPTPLQTPITQPTQAPNTTQPTPLAQVSPTISKSEKTPEIKKIEPTPKPPIQPTKSPIVTPNVPRLATFILLPPTRNNALPTISIPAKTTDIAMQLNLEADDFKSYRVVLKNQAGKTIWQSGKLNSKKTALNVRFPAKLLQSTIYSFEVAGIGESGEAENIGNYSFRSVLR